MEYCQTANTQELKAELRSMGLHISDAWNHSREDLAEIKWIHTGEITPPFINRIRKTVLGLEPVDERRIEEAIRRFENRTKKEKLSPWARFTSCLGLRKRA